MITLTRGQRIALKRIYDRPTDWNNGTYRQFRRKVSPGPGCIMIPWCGMWLGIEPNGYTHS